MAGAEVARQTNTPSQGDHGDCIYDAALPSIPGQLVPDAQALQVLQRSVVTSD